MNLYEGEEHEGEEDKKTPAYIYSYGNEVRNATAEIAYSCTWAAINGKPLSNQYFYNAVQLQHNDLPPDVYSLTKTLGSTDGTGNEVRQEGLVWDNVIEMLNYGNGIAFHNVNIDDETNIAAIKEHYGISQEIILNRLQGRGCKMLAEPGLTNGTYLTAAYDYQPIQIITAQTKTVKLYPFQVTDDLEDKPLDRGFYSIENAKQEIAKQQVLPKEERNALHIGVHGTDNSWVEFLRYLNDTYGKDGDDSVWFTSMEEYYEYNYYRVHSNTPQIEYIDEHTLKLTVNLPSGDYFYHPSVTVNLHGINLSNVLSVASNDAVTGLSYGNHENGLMFNIDCRKFLMEHAIHFVELYEKDKSNKSKRADALYFANRLKDSSRKTELLTRIAALLHITS